MACPDQLIVASLFVIVNVNGLLFAGFVHPVVLKLGMLVAVNVWSFVIPGENCAVTLISSMVIVIFVVPSSKKNV